MITYISVRNSCHPQGIAANRLPMDLRRHAEDNPNRTWQSHRIPASEVKRLLTTL